MLDHIANLFVKAQHPRRLNPYWNCPMTLAAKGAEDSPIGTLFRGDRAQQFAPVHFGPVGRTCQRGAENHECEFTVNDQGAGATRRGIRCG